MEIYQVSGSEFQIEFDSGVENRYLYNPDTGYLLVPAEDYGNFSGEEIQEITNHSDIEGIFNNTAINRAR